MSGVPESPPAARSTVIAADPAAGLARPLRLGVLASGGGTNLQALLDAIGLGLDAEVRLVVCNVPEAGALARAAAAGVPATVLKHRDFARRAEFDAALVDALQRAGVEVVVLAGFMRLLTPRFLDAFPLRVLNVHPALCPAFPGVNAPAQAIARGVALTGCTVHFVDAGTDTGPIIAQVAVPVHHDDDAVSLHRRIQGEEHRLLPKAVGWFAAGRLRVLGPRVQVLPGEPWQSTSTPS